MARDVVPYVAAMALSVSPDFTRYVRNDGVGVDGADDGLGVGAELGVGEGSGSGVVVGAVVGPALRDGVAVATGRVGLSVATGVVPPRSPDTARTSSVTTRRTAGIAGQRPRSRTSPLTRERKPPTSSITVVVRVRPKRLGCAAACAPIRDPRADIDAR